MTVSDEAVEAAARWLHDQDCRSALHSGHPADFPCYDWLEEAKELLAEVTPFIAAQAWNEGRDVAHAEMARMYSSQCEGDDCDCNEPTTNPYRSGQ